MQQSLRILMVLAAIFAASHSSFSQSKLSTINGLLLDQSQQPIAFSTVAVYRSDSSLIKRAISGNTGEFSITHVMEGDFYLIIKNVEYKTYHSPMLTLTPGQTLDLKTITMEPVSKGNS